MKRPVLRLGGAAAALALLGTAAATATSAVADSAPSTGTMVVTSWPRAAQTGSPVVVSAFIAAGASAGSTSSVTTVTVSFGDGSAPVTAKTMSFGPAVAAEASHTYTAAGDYTATVTASSGSAAPLTATTEVLVGTGAARIFGLDRFGTAIGLSNQDFPQPGSAKAVVLASGRDFADALAAAPLARVEQAPVLLTTATAIPAAVQSEIQRVLAPGGTVYVAGGTSAISDASLAPLTAAGYTVDRVAGSNRVDTAVKVAQAMVAAGYPVKQVVVASDSSYPDALAGAAYAAFVKAPVLLTDPSGLSTEDAAFLSGLASKPSALVIGGTSVVSDQVLTDLAPLTTAVSRLGGSDRYATSAAVAKLFPSTLTAMLATGSGFADALTGAASGAGPVLLTGATLPAPVATWLSDHAGALSQLLVLGGTSAVPAGVASLAQSLAGLVSAGVGQG